MVGTTTSFDSALKLLNDELYPRAYSEFVKLAESGDLRAHVVVGWFHEVGQVVLKSEANALRWYELAAAKDRADAYYALGSFYKKKDLYEKALQNYQAAAQKGHLASSFNVGVIYEMGYGVEKDVPYATEWFEFAALGGHIFSQVKISRNYRKERNLKLVLRGYLILIKALILGPWLISRNRYDDRVLE